jgi:DNA-binding transcriptional ArsR family regulator
MSDQERQIYYCIADRSSQAGALQMAVGTRPLKYLLGWLIAGTRGGATRAKIIETLKETPQNANQLANLLGMDYRTIRHHLGVLEKNKIITSAGQGYGTTYFLSPAMEENYALFEEIMKKIWKKNSANSSFLLMKKSRCRLRRIRSFSVNFSLSIKVESFGRVLRKQALCIS